MESDLRGEGRVHPLEDSLFIVGRSPECQLVISHASISRRHAKFFRLNDEFVLEDLNSKNGVYVNGFRISQPSLLHNGDHIRIGDMNFIFKLGEQSPIPEEPSSFTEATRTHTPRLEMLLELSKMINSSLVLADVLDKVMDSVMEITQAHRGFLMIPDSKRELECKVARNLEAGTLNNGQIQISMSTVQRVFDDGTSFISVDIDSDSRVSSQQSIMSLGLKSVMCVPLKHRDQICGIIYVDSHNVARGFNDDDLQILEALADHAAIAIENARLVEENKEMFFSTIEALAEAIEKRDPYTGGHTQRVLKISLDIAAEMKMAPDDQENLKMAALLHDIGKIGIDDSILRKHTQLTPAEFDLIRQHPQIGAEIVDRIRNIDLVLPGILLHHEKFDGTGYPFGYRQEKIPMQARIIAVADSFDAMVTDRPYRKGLPFHEALAELKNNKGSQFDPEVVDVFRRVIDRERAKYEQYYPSTFADSPA
ncbi:MAG: FHA domain-containing protein [Acidobacteria bacterium]|nr:FHA domain-containing protein [Acidobacteriota bacterium]